MLIAVIEAHAKATQVKLDVSQLTDPEKLKQFQEVQNQLSGALGRLLAVSENYPDLKVKPKLSRAAVSARRNLEIVLQ